MVPRLRIRVAVSGPFGVLPFLSDSPLTYQEVSAVLFFKSTANSHRRVLLDGLAHDVTLRQRLDENLAVSFGRDPRIQDHDLAGVSFAANQAPKALLEFVDRFGQLVIVKRIAAGLSNRFQSSLQQGLVWDAKRKLGDDHVL